MKPPAWITYFAGYTALTMIAVSCDSNKLNEEAPDPPNIVFILVDDLGWKDLGCYGSEFYETPNIDNLAERGMKFTSFYTPSAVCSPTRASILTGKHPGRLHITDWTGPDEWHPKGKMATPPLQDDLPKKEVTIAESLKKGGYKSLYLGKWHLGAEHNYPQYHGFDICIGATNAGAPPSYFYPYFRVNWEGTGWPVDIPDLNQGEEGEYLTERLTNEAISFLDTIGNQPFLLYLSHYAVHKPLQAKPKIVEKYRQKADRIFSDLNDSIIREKNNSYTQTRQKNPVYAAMIESVDISTGRIVDKLNELNLIENTVIIFTSDNGGLSTYSFPLEGEKFSVDAIPTSNLPLRAGKGFYYEGGIRVPTIVSWPGTIKPGSVSDELVTSTDFYPTILEMAGLEKQPSMHADAKSFTGILKGDSEKVRETAFWHYPHYHASGQTPVSVVRKNKYKLIYWFETGLMELYNLEEDIAEENDLSEKMPEVKMELMNLLKKWWEETEVLLPESD